MEKKIENSTKSVIEITIRIALLSLLLIWCLMILYPFITPVVWGVVMAVSLSPVYNVLVRVMKGRTKLSATVLTVFLLLIILLPSFSFIESVASSVNTIGESLKEGTLEIPSPNAKIKEWPVIGEDVYGYWSEASVNLVATLEKYKTQVASVGRSLISGVASLTGSVLMFALSIIIGGILLATKGTSDFTIRFFEKVVGKEKGKEFAQMSEKTILNVTKGILGVSFIQALALAIIFYLAGVPYAGLLGVTCLVLAIIQIGPAPVAIGVIVYLFSVLGTGMATMWTILIVIAMISDNVLKPLVLGKGAPVPMLIIFLGSIGGFMTGGFLGLFSGAIILSLGYKLFEAWIDSEG
jgi:predicted PurR-regulated permease PerM